MRSTRAASVRGAVTAQSLGSGSDTGTKHGTDLIERGEHASAASSAHEDEAEIAAGSWGSVHRGAGGRGHLDALDAWDRCRHFHAVETLEGAVVGRGEHPDTDGATTAGRRDRAWLVECPLDDEILEMTTVVETNGSSTASADGAWRELDDHRPTFREP